MTSLRPLVECAGDELRALLAPVTPELFVHEHWAKKALFVKGFPTKYKGLFDRDRFIQAVAQGGSSAPDFLRASFDKKGDRTPGRGRDATPDVGSIAFNASPEQAVPLFKAGATLCATQMEARVPALASFVTAIKRQLGYPGRVTFNAYLSPPGAGFNWHFDGRIASTMQIEGTKRWRFSNRPAVAWPRGNGALRPDGTGYYVDGGGETGPSDRIQPLDLADTTEVVLEPGDLLILPAGAWHDACGGEGGSLALNLSFTPLSYTVLVRELIDAALGPDAEWRGPMPLLPLVSAPTGAVDARGLRAVAEQLGKAAALLASLSADDARVVGVWSSFVLATGLGPRRHRLPEALPVAKNERLRVRSDGDIYVRLADGGTRLCVSVGTAGRLQATGDDLRFVQRMLSVRSFVAADCMTWDEVEGRTTWDEIAAMLTHLLREGVLEREGARDG